MRKLAAVALWGVITCSSAQLLAQQPVVVSAKVDRQLNQLIHSYQNQNPTGFITASSDLLNRSNKEVIEQVNEALESRKLPSLQKMLAHVRVEATKSNIALPAPNWLEFQYIVPEVVDQVQTVIQAYEQSQFVKTEISAPEKFQGYDELIWQLHVFRNRFEVLKKVVNATTGLSEKFSRPLAKHKSTLVGDAKKPFEFDFKAAAQRLHEIVLAIDEKEAEVRVMRIDDANDLIAVGGKFVDQFDAAFALAYDELFFEKFYETAKKENRSFQNADLNDDSIASILSDLVESAKTKNPDLFEKATLFYVGSHWWLRGRYGQGPLANGLLKAKNAAQNEKTLFPLFMPMQMPNVDQLLGNQVAKPVIRRHEFVWGLGDEGIQTMNISSGSKTRVVAQLDRFY